MQVGAPVVPVLHGLHRMADQALVDVHSLGSDLRHVRDAMLAHVEVETQKVAAQTRLEFEQAAITYKEQARRDAVKAQRATEERVNAETATQLAQLRAEYEQQLNELKAEMDELQEAYTKDLDEWQRQCYYYKTSEANLRREYDTLKLTTARQQSSRLRLQDGDGSSGNGLRGKNKQQQQQHTRPASRPIQIHDEAQLLQDLHDKTVELEDAQRSNKTLQLEKKRLTFLLRVVRAKASEQLQQAEVKHRHLQHEIDQTRDALQRTRDQLLKGVSSTGMCVRACVFACVCVCVRVRVCVWFGKGENQMLLKPL